MKGFFLSPLLFLTLLASASFGDTVIPDGTLTDLTSATLNGDVTIQSGGALKLELPATSVLANSITNNGTIGDYSTSTITLTGAVSGTGAFLKAGAGTTILSGSNTYTGVTYVSTGTLQTGAANVIGQQSAVALEMGGTLDLNNFQQSVGSVSGSGSITLGTAALPAEAGLVTGSGGKLTPGAGSGFGGAVSSSTVTLSGATVTSAGGITATTSGGSTSGATLNLGLGNSSGEGAFMVIGASGTGGAAMVTTNAAMGTLVLSSSSASSSVGVILGGATLALGQSNSGGGSVLNGSGTLTLSGSLGVGGVISIINGSSFSLDVGGGTNGGGTNDVEIINGGNFFGTLVISGTNFITTIIPNAFTGSIMNSTGASLTIAGDLTLAAGQSASVSVTGGDLLTLTGSNGVIGSTTLSGTTFTVTRVNTSSLNSNLRSLASADFVLPESTGNGVLITGNDNTNRIYSGTISGNGSVVKVGTGIWNLTGSNSYTGLTTVADGALLVNGSVAGDVFVWGGYLGGSGTIGGSVLNQGIVGPGNSPGTLTIAGDYSQSSTGFLVIQIASTSVFDHLAVSGQASLDGGVLVQCLDGFKLQRGDTFSFLTAAGGITGQFSEVVFPAGSLLGLNLSQDNGIVTLVTVQGSFANDVPNLTPNEKAVAHALDKVVNSSRVAKLVDALDSYSLAAMPSALEKIVPTDLLSMFEASIASATVQADNLERRMEEVRGGATGWSDTGLHLANCHGGQSASGDPQKAIGKDGKALDAAPISDRWGFFVNGSGEFVDIDSSASARGTDFTTGGISTGADYRLGDHAVVGMSAGYANTSSDGQANGSVKINSGKLGLYGTVFENGFFVNGVVGGGLNSYDTKRDTLGGLARGDAEGNDWSALLGTGYTYRNGGWSAGPIASLRYSWVGIDGFTEQGSLAPLRYGDQSESSLRSTTGLQTSYAFQLGHAIITP